jgi:hypothetical protein
MLNPPCSSSPPQHHGKKSKSVSFSNEVSRVDGNAVTIQQEEHRVVPRTQDYFLERSIGGGNPVTSRADETESHDDADRTDTEEGGGKICVAEEISRHDDKNDGEKVGGNRVLVVRMGLLKGGHRYRVVVPIPPLLVDNDDSDPIDEKCDNDDAASAIHGLDLHDGQGSNEQQEMHDDPRKNSNTSKRIRTEARIIQDSWDDDDDLRGEIIETSDDGTPHIGIVLSARQRGPYCGRLAVEFFPAPTDTDKSTPTNNRISSESVLSKSVMSILVEATIMGKGMGTPQLRNGVVCLGKLAGYDSDEETEWQGFD